DRLSAHAPSRTTSARDPAAGCDAAPLSRPFAGAPSRGLALFGLGYSMSGLEGFARTAPLFAAWLYSGRRQEIIDEQTGKSYAIVTILQQGLLAGTDPSSPNYWGDRTSYRLGEFPYWEEAFATGPPFRRP